MIDLFDNNLWQHPAPWLETPNKRRGGWSGVSRIDWTAQDGSSSVAYLKRHEDHTYRAPHKLFLKTPTLEREFNNLRALDRLGFTVPLPLYFGSRQHQGKLQAMLVLKSLEGFQSLSHYLYACQKSKSRVNPNVTSTVAREIARLHQCHWTHRCLYPKHTYVKVNADSTVEVAFIDLESARKAPFIPQRRLVKELGPFYRRCRKIGVSRQDCTRFMQNYLSVERLTPKAQRLSDKIAHSKRVPKGHDSPATGDRACATQAICDDLKSSRLRQ